MGLLSVRSGKKTYFVEFEKHGSTQIELPIEKLRAVFLETNGAHGTSGQEIADCLNQHNRVISMRAQEHGLVAKNVLKKHRKIIKSAKQCGAEIWLGDVNLTNDEDARLAASIAIPIVAGAATGGIIGKKVSRRKVLGGLVGTAVGAFLGPVSSSVSGLLLAKRGEAKNRSISRGIVEAKDSVFRIGTVRNTIMAHKIQALAQKTGHSNIGLLVGAAHVGIATLLEKGPALTPEARTEITKRGPDALKMFRCIYDKVHDRWRVEAHSL